MEHKFSIDNIFKRYLTLKGIPYIILPKKTIPTEGGNYDFGIAPHGSRVTSTGAPYYDKGFYMPVTLGGVSIPYAVTSLSRSKTIVKTNVDGRSGSVKELISLNDTEISITGMVVGNRAYPEAQVAELNALFELNESVDMLCALTNIVLGVDVKVVIERMDLPPLQGVEDCQIVKFKCVTDMPFEIVM